MIGLRRDCSIYPPCLEISNLSLTIVLRPNAPSKIVIYEATSIRIMHRHTTFFVVGLNPLPVADDVVNPQCEQVRLA